MRLIRYPSIMVLAVSLGCAANSAAGQAPAATSKSVTTAAHQRMETTDFVASGRLVQVGAAGDRKSYNFTLKAHWFADGLRMLCEITSPASSRVKLLMTFTAGGKETIDIGKPGAASPTSLPFERWGESLLGTNFSYEDLADAQFFWQKQTLLPDAKYGARDCNVLKSEPGLADRTHYASVTTWIDKQNQGTVHEEKAEKGSSTLKDFVYYDLRKTGSVWSAAQIEAKTQGSPGSSLFIIEKGSANARLDRKDFEPALLVKP
jgi:hypothetical protein